MRRQAANPFFDQRHAGAINQLRANVRHPGVAKLRHAVQQQAAKGVARRDNFGVANAERANARAPVGIEFVEGQVAAQKEPHNRIAARLVAHAAVGMEVRTRAVVQVLRSIVRVHQPQGMIHGHFGPLAENALRHQRTCLIGLADQKI